MYEEVDERDMNIINTKWIIKENEKEGGKIWKARLVAKGFTEKFSNKYEYEATTCSTEGFKIFLMVIKTFGWNMKTLDIKTAYL